MSVQSCKDLKVWQKSIELVKSIYKASDFLPKEEQYGLCSQVRRSAVSVASNIAEGHARDSTKEYLRFISVALGSLSELQTQFIIIKELNFLNDDLVGEVNSISDEVGKMLRGLQKSLKLKLVPNP